MTQRALDSERIQALLRVKKTGDTDYGVELQQGQRVGRVVQIHPPGGQFLFQRLGQGIHVHFQSNGQSSAGADARTDTAVIRALNRLVQLKRVAPEGLVPERIKSENVPAVLQRRESV